MLKRLVTAVAVPLILSACGPPPEPPGPPPLDPTGTFDITVMAEGQSINGVLVINGSEEAGYTGSLDTDMGGASIGTIVVEGRTLTFTIAEIQGAAELTFEEGDQEFSGAVSSAMFEATMFGTRRDGS